MVRLEDLKRGALVKGILPNNTVSIVDLQWYGSSCVQLTYKDFSGRLGHELVYRDREPQLEILTEGLPWSFESNPHRFKLVSEAYRIHVAHLFDPLLAVHTSLVEPLPHQITAVYGEMLRRQPLRFLLADDPGAGKTIMAGLLIKELLLRGDLRRCMIVCPGNLVEQWQDELHEKFQLPFDILTNDKLEAARTGNWFLENNLVICRLDKLARNLEDLEPKLGQTDWDLIICDESHKMSAHLFAGEITYTKRYLLGRHLSQIARHFLLMTATPHNGKEEDFQLFMALLDGDRFEGKFRDGVHSTDYKDLMRRMVKEELKRFDGSDLFPERRAYTVNYKLSELEAALYHQVTTYVSEEFNRADALDGKRKGTIGFALTILQRRLASSPEAIYQSLRRRRERLEKRLREEKMAKRGEDVINQFSSGLLSMTQEDIDDLDDAPDTEVEEMEDNIVDQATAARTIAELETEIQMLQGLEGLAKQVVSSGKDRKWEELSSLLQNRKEMFDAHGFRRKLVIFTEHRDTLNYLADRIRLILGVNEAVVVIHGALGREERKKSQEAFTQDKGVQVLVATDAAGEGINLQRAHLMVNYDLPWNPNRLEQRFGRIHRIGQNEVCHLWNLVAEETREADVWLTLFGKIEKEREAMGGKVFDVLGKVFQGSELRELLIEAIRYGDRPEVREKLHLAVAEKMDHIYQLVEDSALIETLSRTKIQEIREDMERMEARRLQPHFISAFFRAAFENLGGRIVEREKGRYEITHVPGAVRNRDRLIGTREPILPRYERVTFEKGLINPPGKPLAAFVCPGHPLLDATIDLLLEQDRNLLKLGTILLDPTDPGTDLRVLFYLEHSVQDARTDRSGQRRIISKEMQFVEVTEDRQVKMGGYAPYLDYDPLPAEFQALVQAELQKDWLRGNLDTLVEEYAITKLVPQHFQQVRSHKEAFVTKAREQVWDRLTKEIVYWDNRAQQLKDQEAAGKQPKMNSGKALERANDLQRRREARMQELDQELQISPMPPIIIGGAIVVPHGLITRLTGTESQIVRDFAKETKRIELAAMQAVMDLERSFGHSPVDVSSEKRGWDVESATGDGTLRFLEVKGRVAGASVVTVTKREILACLNKPDHFRLAMVRVDGTSTETRYVPQPFTKEPDFDVCSVNYDWDKLWERGTAPAIEVPRI